MKKEYDFSKMKEIDNPYAGKKKAVGINLLVRPLLVRRSRSVRAPGVATAPR